MWLISLTTAFCIWVCVVALSIFISTKKYKSKRILTSSNLMIIGTFASSFIMFLPIYIERFAEDIIWSRVCKTILISAHHTIRLFVIDSDFEDVYSVIRELGTGISPYYSLFFSILYITAPVLTFGFILSFFKNIASYRRLLFAYFKDVYVFSELNEKSIALAGSILSKHNVAVVFTDVFEKNEESSFEMREKAKELGAICFKKDILTVSFKHHSKASKLVFFIMGENDDENLKQSFGIIDTYKERKNTILYIFSDDVDGEFITASARNGNIIVRRVNDARSLVYRTLYDKGEALFRNSKQIENDTRQIGAVVVGIGSYGNEMMRALTWFGQMDGYRISVDAFDLDPLAKSRFTACCPELMSEKYNGVYVEGESQYFIDIHSGISVDSIEFVEELKKLINTTYVFVSLGSDEDNVRCAVNLRKIFEQMGIRPVIHAVVYNTDKKNAFKDVKNYRGQSYDIVFVGDLENLYSADVIIDSELERAALKRHLKWGDEEDFWAYDYNYRSSMASAVHMMARIACGIPGAEKKEEDLTDEEKAVIEPLEHRRWNAYMRSEGYIYSGSHDKKSRNDLGKMHHDLVDFASLTEDEKRKDSRVGSK